MSDEFYVTDDGDVVINGELVFDPTTVEWEGEITYPEGSAAETLWVYAKAMADLDLVDDFNRKC